MSNSAITLQCPSCGGIFITLQQSSGPMEICPHCAVSSPRNLFLPAQGGPQPRSRTTLPSRRATGELPRQLHPEAHDLDAINRGHAPEAGTIPSQSIGNPLPPSTPAPHTWEPAPQVVPQGTPGTASFATHPAPPSFASSSLQYGHPAQAIAPLAEPAPLVSPPAVQLPELQFPAVSWDTPPPQQAAPTPSQLPAGWQPSPPTAPAAGQGFPQPLAAPPFPSPATSAPPAPLMATPPASPLQLPPPPHSPAAQQATLFARSGPEFGSAPPSTSPSHFTPTPAPEVAPPPPPPFTPAPSPPPGFASATGFSPTPPIETPAHAPFPPQGFGAPSLAPAGTPPNTTPFTVSHHPSGWGPAVPPGTAPQGPSPAPTPANEALFPLQPPPPLDSTPHSSTEFGGIAHPAKPAGAPVPPANTPLAFFGIPSQEEPVETAPVPAPSAAEQLSAVQPAPFSWPPQQQTPQAMTGNSLGWAPGAPPIVHATQQFAPHPIPPVEPVNHPPPTWPGLGLEGSDQRNHPFASLFGRDASPQAGQVAPSPGSESGAAPPPPAKRTSPILVILLLAIIGGTFWYAWKNRDKLLKLTAPSQSEAIIPLPPLEFAPAAPPEPTPAPASEPSIDPLDAATPDITHNIAAADRAAVLVKTLDAAVTEEDRLKVIFHAQDHKADVKRFFDSLDNQLKPILLDPTPAVVSPLLTGPKLRLFRLVTATCAKGAILRMEGGPNDTQLLDWPLFMQTHEQHFDKFVKSNPAPEQRKAEWFTVLCKRRHDFDLPKDTQDAYVCLEAQGSLSPDGSTVLYVNKGLPAGRLLETHLKWAEIYLVDLLVGKAEIGGSTTHVVLDCTGTDTARK